MDSIGKIFVTLGLAASLLLVSGCDFFRTLASRPTSADIQAKKHEIEIYEARMKAVQDSIKAAEAARLRDSMLVQESISTGLARTSSNAGFIDTENLGSRYYVIVGAFSMKGNAEKLAEKVEQAGYKTAFLKYRNGYTAVGVCPSDSFSEVCDKLSALMGEPFCPKDMWIFINE